MADDLHQLRKMVSASALKIKALEDRLAAVTPASGSDKVEKLELVVKAHEASLKTIRGQDSSKSDSAALLLRLAKLEAKMGAGSAGGSGASTPPVGQVDLGAVFKRLDAQEAKLVSLELSLSQANKKIKELESQKASPSVSSAAMDKMAAKLSALEKSVSALQSSSSSSPAASPPPPSSSSSSSAAMDKLAAKVASLEKSVKTLEESKQKAAVTAAPPVDVGSLPPPPVAAAVPPPVAAAVPPPAAAAPPVAAASPSDALQAAMAAEQPPPAEEAKKETVDLDAVLGETSHAPLKTAKRPKARKGTRKIPSKQLAELGAEIAIEQEAEKVKVSEPEAAVDAEEAIAAAAAQSSSAPKSNMGFGMLPGMEEALKAKERGTFGMRRRSNSDASVLRRMSAPASGSPSDAPIGPHLLKKTGGSPGSPKKGPKKGFKMVKRAPPPK